MAETLLRLGSREPGPPWAGVPHLNCSVRQGGFGQAVAERLRDTFVAPVILVQPVAVEIANHLVERDTVIGVPVAHDLEAAKESDIMLCCNHLVSMADCWPTRAAISASRRKAIQLLLRLENTTLR